MTDAQERHMAIHDDPKPRPASSRYEGIWAEYHRLAAEQAEVRRVQAECHEGMKKLNAALEKISK